MKHTEYEMIHNVSWSKIFHPKNDMTWHVRDMMSDPRLKYHNIDHVRRLYMRAGEWRIPYDINLDVAILWHDSVYDEHPNKEIRSAEAVKAVAAEHPEWFEGVDIVEVNKMIINTVSHKYIEDVNPWMIRLDVAELADPDMRYDNFWSLLEEARELYGIDNAAAAAGTESFMKSFRATMAENSVNDYEFMSEWGQVAEGCTDVITMARVVQDIYARGT